MYPGALLDAFATGRSQWPEVRSSTEAFGRYLDEVLGEPPAADWARHAGDLYLCCGCINGDTNAERMLEARFLAQLTQSVARIRPNDDFIQETLQSLRTKLLVHPERRLMAYSGRGPLLAWLRVTVTRLALDSLRSQARAVTREDPLEQVATAELDPLSAVLKARYALAFQQALHEAWGALPERDRNLLRLRLVDGCGIDRLGCMYQVDRATAARWLKGAKDRVFRRVRRTLSGLYGLTHQEFQSMARVVLSQLELRPSAFAGASGAEPGSVPSEGNRALSDSARGGREDGL